MVSTTDAPVDATGSESHLPESHTGEGVAMRPNAEEASDAVPADSVSVKESSTEVTATAATEGNTHIDLDLTNTTTEIEVASLNPTDEERQTITAETSNVAELTIEDILRQAGWESRGETTAPQGTAVGASVVSASGTGPKATGTAQQTRNEAKTGGNKTPSQPAQGRATGPPPPSSGRKGQPAAQDNSKKNDSKKNDGKKTTNSTA